MNWNIPDINKKYKGADGARVEEPRGWGLESGK